LAGSAARATTAHALMTSGIARIEKPSCRYEFVTRNMEAQTVPHGQASRKHERRENIDVLMHRKRCAVLPPGSLSHASGAGPAGWGGDGVAPCASLREVIKD
jgi:hypothetical protein